MKLDYFTIKRKTKNPTRTDKATRKLEIYMKPKFSYELSSFLSGKKCWMNCGKTAHKGECNAL